MPNELVDILERHAVERRLPEPDQRRAIRLHAGLTQAEIAAAVGVTRATVTRWESGERTPRGDRCRRYVTVLELVAPNGARSQHPCGRRVQ